MSQHNHYADVAAFNEACGVYRVAKFGDPLPPDELAMRRRLVTEEYEELSDAIKKNDRVEIADACADLAYVCLGWMWATRWKAFDTNQRLSPKYDSHDITLFVQSDYHDVMETNEPFHVGLLTVSVLNLGYCLLFPMGKIWAEVQRSNMAKVVNGVVTRRADGKIVKPKGWTPPDIRGILERECAL